MNKKKIVYFGSGIVVALFSVMIYSFYFSSPSPFPSEEELIEEMTKVFPEAEVSQIREVIDVTDREKFVPIVTKKDSYGKSFWVWDKYKWQVTYIDMTGNPLIWKANEEDPSTYHIVWNIHPDDQLKHIKFYMVRDRGYRTTEGTYETYYPRVQMDQTISLEKKSYGVMQIPKEWSVFITSLNNAQFVQQPDLFFTNFYSEQQVFYGWTPYGQDNKLSFPENSVNGTGYSNGGVNTEHVMILDENEIEIWKEE
ncbi:hypothetical protein ACFSCX_23610 [Bacillus salitolerans]|uniref:Uncharacterized protein n=1 Tax=Bacillus salitolerans TaxID=1437434 RepID=A0ABW4LWK7_9BACI